MATVQGMTPAKILELVGGLVKSVTVNQASGVLSVERHNGQIVNAGNPADVALQRAYPVGSVFISAVPTNPGTLLGIGTWEAFATGRTLVGVDPAQAEFDAVLETGGAKTHTLTEAEMPSHKHSIDHDHASFNTASGGAHDHTITLAETTGGNSTRAAAGNAVTANSPTTGGSGNHVHAIDVPAHTGDSGLTGSGVAHNIMQPYITVYMWRRTA